MVAPNTATVATVVQSKLCRVLEPKLVDGNALASGTRGQEFNYRSRQIGQSDANGSLPLQHFFERSCFARAQ